jgi:hypothetical protein
MSMITKNSGSARTCAITCLCSVVKLKDDARHVEFAESPADVESCEYLAEVTGSEGHWYTYLFLANRTMVQSALDDLRNRAAERGANTVFIGWPHDFVTSVTMYGLAYRCPENNRGK